MDTRHFREQLSIETPEQVALSFPMAGLGSRILAHLLDLLILAGTYAVLGIIVALTVASRVERTLEHTTYRQDKWIVAGFLLLNFLFLWGYYTLFEAFWNGQTPGKRVTKIRVLKDSGRQITLFESMARNILRVIDVLPSAYIVGITSILISKQNKRLGDLLGGTLVVRALDIAPAETGMLGRTFTASLIETPVAAAPTDFGVEFSADAIARLSQDDLVVLESFFARIPELSADTVERIAQQILNRLCHKMNVAVPTSVSSRRSLDAIAFSLRSSAVYR